MIKLLLIEDDANLAFIEKSTLEDIVGGYEVMTVSNGKDGIKAWEEFKPDVIISDIDMPIMNGIEMVKHIREIDGDTLILFTTNLASPKKLEEGYAAGANNYIKKPFVPEELDAHIQSLLRLKNGQKSRNVSSYIKIGKHILDPEHACIKDEEGNISYTLTARDAKILEMLAKNKNEIVKREAIQEHIWNTAEKDFFISRCLDTVIVKLRKVLKSDTFVSIETIRGVGFKLTESC